jgi:hypothetical protein
MKLNISILPKSVLGWWPIGLVVATLAFMELAESIISPGETGANFNIPLAVALTFVLAVIAGAAFAAGLISIIKRKQGAILVFISTAIGLVFLIGGLASAVGTLMGLPYF